MEEAMPARTTRKEARQRLLKTFLDAMDRIIPEDESKPLQGRKFGDWEDQADVLKRGGDPNAAGGTGGPGRISPRGVRRLLPVLWL